MAIFERDIGSIVEGAKTLLAARGRRGPSSRTSREPSPLWSIAELELSDDDHERLVSWLRRCDVRELDSWLNTAVPVADLADVTRHEATGLLLLATIAEQARRRSASGEVWPSLVELVGNSPRGKVLLQQGQPTLGLKQAIMAACKRFNLRHRPANGAGQDYYVTVCLQFGLAHSFAHMIPHWLANQQGMPAALQTLSGTGPDRSEGFGALWRELGAAKKDPERARMAARKSPWLRPEWADAFVDAALRVTGPVRRSPASLDVEDDEPLDGVLVDQLEVSGRPGGDAIRVTARVARIPLLSSPQRTLCLWANGDEKADLTFGGSRYSPTSERITLPLSDEVYLEVFDRDAPASSLSQQVVHPFGRDGDVVVLQPGPTLLLGVPREARVFPSEIAAKPIGQRRLVVVRADGEIRPRVELRGEVIWEHRGPAKRLGSGQSSHVEIPSGWLLTDGPPLTLDPTGEVELRVFRQRPFRSAGAAGWLLDGERLIRRASTRPIRLGNLAGVGEAFTYRVGEALPAGEVADVVLVGAVVDHGWVRAAEHVDGLWHLSLTQPVDPDDDWRVVVWGRHGEGLSIPFPKGEPLVVDAPAGVRAIALVAGESVMGTYWAHDWSVDLPESDVKQTATMIRWLRLPLLQAPHRERVKAFVRAHFVDVVLRCWSNLEVALCGVDTKKVIPPDEAWLSSVRALLPDAYTRADADAVAGVNEGYRAGSTARLVSFDPEVFLAYARYVHEKPNRAGAWREDLRSLLIPDNFVSTAGRLLAALQREAGARVTRVPSAWTLPAVTAVAHGEVVEVHRRAALSNSHVREARACFRAIAQFSKTTAQ